MPRHLGLHDLFPGDGWKGIDAVTGRRLVLGNADVRISYAVVGSTSPLYRNAVGDECVFVESGTATVETVFGSPRGRAGRLRRHPARDHPPLGDLLARRGAAAALRRSRPTATSPRRSATCPASASSSSTRRTASATCARRTRCSSWSRPRRRRDVEVYVKHRGTGAGGLAGTVHVVPNHPFDVVGLGRLPLPLRLQRRGLRADHRPGPPAAAGPPGLRGAQLRDLQLRAAQGRLPPARGAGALLPLQRRQRRGDVLRRRRLRGPQGIGHRDRVDHPAPRRARHGPQPERDRGQPRRRAVRRARGHGRHLPAARARRGRPGQRRRRVRVVLGGRAAA